MQPLAAIKKLASLIFVQTMKLLLRVHLVYQVLIIFND